MLPLLEASTFNLDGIVGAAGAMIASIIAVIKWVGRDLVRAIDRNTTAVDANTKARKDSSNIKATGAVALLLVSLLFLGGCVAGPDPLALEYSQKARKFWQEDQRADLNPEVIKSREAFFDAGDRYFRGAPEASKAIAETPTR